MRITTAAISSIFISCIITSGCTSTTFFTGLVVAPAFSELSNQSLREQDLYLAGIFDKNAPINARTVNYGLKNNTCLLNVAIERNRFDIVREALRAGATPAKCKHGPVPFVLTLSRTDGKRYQELSTMLNEYGAMKGFDTSIIIRYGIDANRPDPTDMIQFALNLGADINKPIHTYTAPVGADASFNRTPLYEMTRQYINSRGLYPIEAIQYVVASGARYDPMLDAVLQEDRFKKLKKADSAKLLDILEMSKRPAIINP